jgi:hypothetical protein
MSKECKFCGQLSTYAPLDEFKRFKIDIYYCHTCQAEYLYWSNGDISSWSLYTTINDRMYRITYSYPGAGEVHGITRLWYIQDPGNPGTRKNNGCSFISNFDNIEMPEITPHNVNEKIRSYLLFI